MLQEQGVTHLVFMGVTTEVCVQTSMREANDRGYDCLLVEDGTESYFPEFKAATLAMIVAQGAIVGWQAQRHFRQERRRGQFGAHHREVVVQVQHDLIAAGAVLLTNQQRLGGTPARGRHRRFERHPPIAFEARQRVLEAGAGDAVEGVDRVRGEARRDARHGSRRDREPRGRGGCGRLGRDGADGLHELHADPAKRKTCGQEGTSGQRFVNHGVALWVEVIASARTRHALTRRPSAHAGVGG
jgi:hypothetical protein